MKTKIVYSEKCLGYGTWHVEGPQRVKVASEILKAQSYEFVEPQAANDDQLLSVHDAEYLFNVKKGLVADCDTPAYDKIYDFAALSAGGALLASKIGGFSLMRPPGHHVGKYGAAMGASSRGFCYLNNIAIAVRESGKPTLILDIDGHHGNGTQEVFEGDPKVAYVSLHQSPNYPGTGSKTEGNAINYALPPNCGGARYLKTLSEALAMVDLNRFETVAVSAGFDTHVGDLATLGLLESDYFKMGEKIASLNKPTFFVLEGGYIGKNLGFDIDNLLKGYGKNKK